MKLHLPKSLRTALLTCLAAISPWSLTLATGAISVGAVVFSLGAQVQAKTISITADTIWNVTTDHSEDVTTVSGEGTELKVGNDSGGDAGLPATGEIKLGELTIEEAATLTISGTTTADRTTNPDAKVGVFGAITLSDSTLYFTDGSYYMEDAVTVSGASTVRSQWGKAVQFSALVGEESSVLTLANQSNGENPAGFILGVGGSSSAEYSGTIKLVDERKSKSVQLVLNDSTAYSAAAFELDSRSNVIVALSRVSLESLYGSGSVGKSSAYGSNAAGATLVVSGNAAEDEKFSGTVESAVTWQIGDGTKAASSRFNGATLKGTLNVQTKATAYLTGANSVATLNNDGTLSFADGSTLTLGSMANDFYGGKTYDVGNLALTSGGTVSNWAPYFGYNDGTEMTYQDGQLTVTVDGSGYYWNGTADSYSWSATNLLKGGNAASIAVGGRLYLTADAAYKTVNMDSTVALAGIILQSNGYTLNVTADNSIPANFVVGDSSYTLTKTGAATLTMSSAQVGKLRKMIVEDGTVILTPTDGESSEVQLNKGALQLGNNGASSGVVFDDMVINAADGTNLTIQLHTDDAQTAAAARQLGVSFNINGTVNMAITDGSYHFAEKISLSEGAKLSINNGWDKNQFFSAIDAANATIVMAAANQINWNTPQRLFLLNSDGDFNLQGSKIELKSAARGEYVHGLAVQKAGALSGAEVSFSSDASDKGSVLLFTNAEYSESTVVKDATRVDGAVAGLSGTKGKVYAAGLTINTAAEKSYTYGGELHITSLTKSGAGSQSLTQGLNLSGALTVEGGSLTLAGIVSVGSRIFVDNGATLNTATTAVSGTVTTGATEGATLNLGAVTIAKDGTLKIEGAGKHTLSTLAMVDNSTLELATGTSATITDSAHHAIGNGKAVTITLGAGATLTDAGSWQLTGSTMTVQGGGEYKLNSLVLSANQAVKTTVNVESGTTLHITGTATNGSKQDASFGLGHWNANNAVNVRGVLELECGISSYSGYSNTATITVESGGKIAFNDGLHAAGKDNAGVININGGGVLEVSGTNVTGTNLVTVDVKQDGIVMGGNANGATESKIANNLNFGGGAYIGAKKGTTLTIAPEDGSTNLNWLVVLGDGTEVSTDNAGGMVAFDNALTVNNNVYIRKGGGLGVLGNITTPKITNMGALVFDGAGTITLNQAILNAGTVEILNAADTQFVLSNGLMQEIVGVSKTWTLVDNTGVKDFTGTITGWDELELGNFLLDGSALQQGDWDGYSIADGKVMLYMLTRYWDATGDEGVWNTGADANWREFADATATVTFETNSRVTFTDTDETGKTALDKSVTVADAGVHAKSVVIAGSDYEFIGGKVLVNESLSALQNARFDSAVVIGSSAPLQLDVAAGATLTLSTLETVSTPTFGGVQYQSGAFRKTGAGTLLITDAINGTITGATVSGGKLALGSGVNLAVGANTVTGGSLGNVELLSSGTVTDYTGATAQANNVIKSADGENYAMLTDVALHAGAATGYASLQKVAFAGNSTLSGYITYESTKQQRQMAVATGGKLTVSNLTFDLHGLSAGTKVLIENEAVEGAAEGFKGELEGWNSDNVTLLYSGIAVNSAAVNMKTAGVVVLNTAESNNKANMYWDGLVAGAAEGDDPVTSNAWDKSSANWSTTAAGTNGSSAFLALSNTYFGATPGGGSKDVNAAQDMVMSNMFVTEGGYSFTGSRLATLGNMYITPESGTVSFANELVAQGNVELRAEQGGSVTLGGALQAGGTITANVEGALSFDNAVSAGGKVELNAQNLEVNGALRSAGDVSISSGTKTAGGAGSLTIGESGSITGANVTINVNAGAASDTHYGDYVVESAGAITATAEGGKVSFTGNGAAHITGTVTADEIVVATQSSNGVIFRQINTNTLTITEGSYAALTDETSTGQSETSRIGTIKLGGTFGLTQFAGKYSGYNLVTTSDSATVNFATIAKVTLASVRGEQLANGTYGSIVFNDSYRELTVDRLQTVNNITFGKGEYWAKLNNATGAIYGDLTVRGGGGLYVSSDNIMANGSGAWNIGGPLYLQGTTQTLAGNAVYLDGAVISGTHDSGMNYTADSQIHYAGTNTISANMTVAEGKVLTIEAGHALEDILMLNGNLQGGGDVLLTGSGRVSLGAANAFKGTMTVQEHTQLRLDNTQALASANLVLAQNGVLIVDRSAVDSSATSEAFSIAALQVAGGMIQMTDLLATDTFSATDAALNVGGLRSEGALNLTLAFTGENALQTMKTYNLFTSADSLAEVYESLALNLYITTGNGSTLLDSSQYKLVYDSESKVIAIRTMLGNVWSGGPDSNDNGYVGDGIWSANNKQGNWSGKDYAEGNAAIFVDLTNDIGTAAWSIANVAIEGGYVEPGTVYFEADKTYYNLSSAEGNGLLAGTNINKAGVADVHLSLAGNATMDNAVGSIDLQKGYLYLDSDLAVAGDITIGVPGASDTQDTHLRAFDGALVREHYTAKGEFSNLLMSGDSISGASATDKGVIKSHYQYGNVNIAAAAGKTVLLENLTFASASGRTDDVLTNVTIGQNVDVTGYYTLNGHITFLNTLQNTGTVALAADATVEIGSMGYTYSVATAEDSTLYGVSAGGAYYKYQLVTGGTINGMNTLTVDDVYVNGVKLGGTDSGLANGVAAVITDNQGALTLSIGAITSGEGQSLTVDGKVGIPTWDERWGNKGNQPALGRLFTDAAATGNFNFSSDAYLYGNIVNAENAVKVNGGNGAIVAILAKGSFNTKSHSEFVSGAAGEAYAGYETWIYDSSDAYQVIAGQYVSGNPSFAQTADTHLYVDADNQEKKGFVVGGSWSVAQNADSYVTVKKGTSQYLVGAGVFSAQTGTAHVYVDGGTLDNVFGAGYGNGASLSADVTKNPNAVEMLLTGGTMTNVYGGAGSGSAGATPNVTGNIAVTVEGNATITSLYGGSMNGGTVTGNITLDLVSGTITNVHAAGTGSSTVNGNVLVNLTQGFNVTGGLYGGKQANSGVTLNRTSTLAFVSEGATYDMSNVTVQGFDTFSLADGSYVKVTTDGSRFGTDTASGVLTISGAGKVELVGGTDLGRNITLTNGATLWFNSDKAGNDIGNAGQNSTAPAETRYLLTATAGTTIEITGRPTKDGDGLCVWLDLAGHGAEGKGALYKALNGAETTPAGKVALPKVTLSDSASVNAEDNIYFIEWKNVESELKLKGNTLTKVGAADLVLYNSTVTDTSANDTDTGVDGTIFVKEGTLGTGYGMRASKTNIVLSFGSELWLTDKGTDATNISALSGSGSVNLENALLITTSTSGSYGKGSDWMTEGADAYSQFSADSGFAYGVYSGAISGANSVSVNGNAVQYLSGSESTFSGGVHMYDSATLYLMSGTSGSAVQGNSTVTAGVVGTGAIAWDSPDAKLYLGNGVQVYNAGTTNVANSNMIIGVEAAPHGDALSNYVGVNSKGADGVLYITVGGKEYVEIDTHNLQSITCDGMYADGTAYVAGTEIDRNKMLLVEKSVWELNTATVAGFSAGGYNTATYSGVLSGNANLVKVGLGTLILDQTNTYTGKTIISEGSLVLKGWAQIGGSADSAALNVEQAAGSTLMLAYDGTYGNEITEITNDIAISGTGDVRWTTEAATNETTAALISSVSGQTPFTLSGDISGGGNLLHCGSGTLVLSGDSSFTGGTHATRGVVEVQSATGLGAGKVVIDSSADLHVTVEDGTTDARVVTTLATAGTTVQGDVVISGTESTERILNVATGGYDNSSTTLHDNGTLLVNGAGVAASTGTLSGTGTVAVSDATGSGASATVGQMTAYTGDFVVEGNKASITVENGNYSGGSISVSGNDAVLSTKGDITITNGESLSLSSRGNAGAENDAAYVTTTGSVSVASGATLSVSDAATSYEYNLQNLQAAASLNGAAALKDGVAGELHGFGANVEGVKVRDDFYFNSLSSDVMNSKAAGAVDAKGGLTMASGATYETAMANTSLMGGSLTLESGLTLSTTLDLGAAAIDGSGRTTQLVLFSDVSGVNFVLDDINAVAKSGIYYTKAENYITGNYIDENTWLVYDSGAGVVYLDGIVPEPTTATLSLLALAALAARRRRR